MDEVAPTPPSTGSAGDWLVSLSFGGIRGCVLEGGGGGENWSKAPLKRARKNVVSQLPYLPTLSSKRVGSHWQHSARGETTHLPAVYTWVDYKMAMATSWNSIVYIMLQSLSVINSTIVVRFNSLKLQKNVKQTLTLWQ